jgi:hypothetical protein
MSIEERRSAIGDRRLQIGNYGISPEAGSIPNLQSDTAKTASSQMPAAAGIIRA